MTVAFICWQNYDAMVKLVEDLEQIPQNKITGQFCVMYLYAFALNRSDGSSRAKIPKL